MTVRLPLPPITTKSRNVKRFVRAVLAYEHLLRLTGQTKAEVVRTRARLTGGQLAEATRLLTDLSTNGSA